MTRRARWAGSLSGFAIRLGLRVSAAEWEAVAQGSRAETLESQLARLGGMRAGFELIDRAIPARRHADTDC